MRYDTPPNDDVIEDTQYDVVVLGTGLEEAIVAGALARGGMKVLHLEEGDTYGGDWATLTYERLQSTIAECTGEAFAFREYPGMEGVNKRRGWNVDLVAKGLASAGEVVETLIESKCGRYLEFKNVDRSLVYGKKGQEFWDLPAGRAAVFKTKQLAPMEKRRLMQLMQYCDDAAELPDGWAARPVTEFLTQHIKMSENLRSLVLFAILGLDDAASKTTTRSAIATLRTVAASVGRYGPTNMIYNTYGSSDLLQAFCRVCAIYRGVQVLRRTVADVIVEDGVVKGVRCSAGQTFACRHVVVPGAVRLGDGDATDRGVASAHRAVVITKESFFERLTAAAPPRQAGDDGEDAGDGADEYTTGLGGTLYATIPPGSLADGLPTRTIHVFQLTDVTMACPAGYVTTHFTQPPTADARELQRVVATFFDAETGQRVGKAALPEGEGAPKSNGALATAFFALPLPTDSRVGVADGARGVYRCGTPSATPSVDDAMRRAQGMWKGIMEAEVAYRGVQGGEPPSAAAERDDAPAAHDPRREVPFEPHVFMPPLPDPEANIVGDDPESILLGVSTFDAEAAQESSESAAVAAAAAHADTDTDTDAKTPPPEPAAHADPCADAVPGVLGSAPPEADATA